MEITIRKALLEDACDLTDCLISCWLSAYKEIVPNEYLSKMPTERDNRVERWKNNITDPGDCVHYCVLYAEKMIGFLTIHKKDGDIWSIYLIEEFCGKGYGKEVLEPVLKNA